MATQGDTNQVTNNSSSGYCKMPDGTLICWGNVIFPAQAAGKQLVQVTYPISFASQPCTTISWNDSENVDAFFGYVWVASPSATGFSACAKRLTATYNWYARWIAVGRWK